MILRSGKFHPQFKPLCEITPMGELLFDPKGHKGTPLTYTAPLTLRCLVTLITVTGAMSSATTHQILDEESGQ
jgi:hypothetical protein